MLSLVLGSMIPAAPIFCAPLTSKRSLPEGLIPTPPAETVSQASVDGLQSRLRELVAVEIQEGMGVRIVDGPLSGIRGNVVGVSGKHATLLVEMRSIRAIQYLPCFLLRPLSDEDE